MKKQKVSIKDIAAQLNISKTTVSFILNGKAKEKRISEKLVDKVLKLVEEVGYQPNQLAQSLRTGKTKILGLMVEDISNQFFSSVAKYIESKAHEHGYKIIYCSTENDNTRARDFLKMFHNLGVDGYILTPTDGIADEIQWLISQGENVILFDRNFDDVAADFVMVDNTTSTYNGTRHLIEQGSKKIAFITLDSGQPQMVARLEGYENAMQEHQLQPLCFPLTFKNNYKEFTSEIATILKENASIDAVLFGTNYLGVSGLEAVATLKLEIPKQLAVVSFDDNDLFRITTPTITAISQPLEEIAETIITTLLDKMGSSEKSNASKKPLAHFLPTQLIIRKSSMKEAG